MPKDIPLVQGVKRSTMQFKGQKEVGGKKVFLFDTETLTVVEIADAIAKSGCTVTKAAVTYRTKNGGENTKAIPLDAIKVIKQKYGFDQWNIIVMTSDGQKVIVQVIDSSHTMVMKTTSSSAVKTVVAAIAPHLKSASPAQTAPAAQQTQPEPVIQQPAAYRQTPAQQQQQQTAYQQAPDYQQQPTAYQQAPDYQQQPTAYQQTPDYRQQQQAAYQQAPDYQQQPIAYQQAPDYQQQPQPFQPQGDYAPTARFMRAPVEQLVPENPGMDDYEDDNGGYEERYGTGRTHQASYDMPQNGSPEYNAPRGRRGRVQEPGEPKPNILFLILSLVEALFIIPIPFTVLTIMDWRKGLKLAPHDADAATTCFNNMRTSVIIGVVFTLMSIGIFVWKVLPILA